MSGRLSGGRQVPGAPWLSSSLYFGMSRLEFYISGIHGCTSDCACGEGERINGPNLCRLELRPPGLRRHYLSCGAAIVTYPNRLGVSGGKSQPAL